MFQTVENKRSEKLKTSENNPNKHTFLEHVFKLEDVENMWSKEMSVAETQTVLVAGGDTTSLTTGYVLMMLGMHQDIQVYLVQCLFKVQFNFQNKTYEELVCVFGDSQREVSLEDLHQLTYLERVIKETLRLFPIGPVLGRHLTSDLVLGAMMFLKFSAANLFFYQETIFVRKAVPF